MRKIRIGFDKKIMLSLKNMVGNELRWFLGNGGKKSLKMINNFYYSAFTYGTADQCYKIQQIITGHQNRNISNHR